LEQMERDLKEKQPEKSKAPSFIPPIF
jgi:hypothetical protein